MKIRIILLISAAVLFCTASISGQYSHTWVSGSGSNFNPCTFASPCASFQGALGSTTPGGIITAMDAGDFGPVTINQSVTIDGNNLGSITFSGVTGISITAPVNVTVQNLTINGLGSGQDGIYATDGGFLIVDNCKVMNFTGFGIGFAGTGSMTVENSRVESMVGQDDSAIKVFSTGAEDVAVRNTVIDASATSNYNIGFQISYGNGPVTAALQNVMIKSAGDYAVNVANGVTEISGSVLTSSGTGVFALHGATVSVATSMITANTYGICSGPNSKIRLDNNDIYDNPTAIENCSGFVKTSGTNKTSGTIAIPALDISESVTF